MGIISDHIKELVKRQVDEKKIVVWFDPERHYEGLIDEISFEGVHKFKYEGSFFGLRHRIHPLLEDIDPPNLLVYVPLAEEETHYALAELTVPGEVMKPGQHPWQKNTRLSVIAGRVLKEIIGEQNASEIENQVKEGQLSLKELDELAVKGEGMSRGVITAIFGSSIPRDIAVTFLGTREFDEKITEKDALEELTNLLESSFETKLSSIKTIEGVREKLSLHLLGTEFILSLGDDIPDELKTVQLPEEAASKNACVETARSWRNDHRFRKSYPDFAMNAEKALNLASMDFDFHQLKNTNTFLHTETMLQQYIEEALPESPAEELMEIINEREDGFWASINPEKVKSRWILVSAAGRLILQCKKVETAVKEFSGNIVDMIGSYTVGSEPWCLMDTCYRHLEQRYHNFDMRTGESHKSLDKLIAKAKQMYWGTAGRLAEIFSRGIVEEKFQTPGVQRQIKVFENYVKTALEQGKTAYFLVDALRYEMGKELAKVLSDNYKVELDPAMASVPTITEIGMASLLPDIYDAQLVESEKGKIALKIKDKVLKNRQDRMEYLESKFSAFSTKLEDIIPKPRKKIEEKIKKAELIVVTSQEIDSLCEEGNISIAHRLMDDVFLQLRSAFRILFELGVKTIIVASDHGYLFGEEMDSDMKIAAPGGETVDLHRRIWVGRGGEGSNAFIRFTSSDVGFEGELELAAPLGLGIFKAKGGGRAYFHGGISPQEMIIPVIKILPGTAMDETPSDIKWTLTPGSNKLSTRFFTVTISNEQPRQTSLFPLNLPKVQVEIRERNNKVSKPIGSSYGFNESTGDIELRLSEGKIDIIESNTVTLMITDDISQKTVNILLVDAVSGVELARIDKIEVAISF